MNKVITPEQIENLSTYLDERYDIIESGIGGKPDEVYYKGFEKSRWKKREFMNSLKIRD